MITRVFSGDGRPILPSLLDFLWEDAGEVPPDLSTTSVVVPTRNVGRRLRSALAGRASAAGRALLSPQVFTPGSLFAALSGEDAAAPRPVRMLCVETVLGQLNEGLLAAAFGGSPAATIADRLRLADFFLETRSLLGEAALDFQAMADRPGISDRDRWRALAACENAYRRELASRKLADPDDRAAEIARAPKAWFRGRRLVVAATPDFPARMGFFLENLAETLEVLILVPAPPGEEHRFDRFGRPDPRSFRGAPLVVPEASIRLSRDVGEAVATIARRIEEHPDSRSGCVCGVGRPIAASLLSFEMRRRGLPVRDPSGVPFSATEAGCFFRNLAGIAFGEEIGELSAWLRDPFVGRWFGQTENDPAERGTPALREHWIAESDRLREDALPSRISDFLPLLARGGRHRLFAETLGVRRAADRLEDPFELFALRFLRPLLDEVEKEEGVSEFAERLHDIREWTSGKAVGHREATALFLWAIEEAMDFPVYPDRDHDGVEVLGWLELLWDERPWLQIPDLYDGAIPASTGSHPLLPESLREEMGLPCRKQRDARDAFILGVLCRQRETGGRVDLHVPARDTEGAVVQPSRLLFFTEENNLAARVRSLTTDPSPPPESVAAPKPLIVPAPDGRVETWLESLDQISVTAFASWIRCPFTFFLEQVCGYETVDPDGMEMDARHFGTLVHEVLQHLEESEDVDWNELEHAEHEASRILESLFARKFGKHPGLLLQLQYEGLLRRIRAAVGIRAAARAEGWRPVRVEWGFGDEAEISIDGIALRGKIDLLEERGEELRIVDYKTSDKPEIPLDAHHANLGRAFSPCHLLPFAGTTGSGWKNLQLPLYAAAARKLFPGRHLRAAYGILPRAVTESRLAEWPDFDEEIVDSALEAARKIIALWRRGGFWPPHTSNFRGSDAYAWSGPAGDAGWDRGTLLDISELRT